MKILVGISTYSANLKDPSGGSERQALGQALALNDRGHDVRYKNLMWKSVDWGRGYDLIHLVNANGPNGPYQFVIQEAHDRGIPVVLNPVYWPVEEMKEEMMTGIDSDAVIQLYFESFRPVLKDADVLLPNAEQEMRKVEEFADATDLTYQVVPNAVDLEEVEKAESGQSPDEWGDYVLSVGRMEPRKNQHKLVEAMEMLWLKGYDDLNLVCIGNPNHAYLERFSDIFEGHEGNLYMSEEALPTKAVMSAMKDAEVLAMPSWLETPGLVALEAAAVGTDIVPTNRGTTQEYFGDLVPYCEPDQPYTIAEGIEKAVNRETPEKLQELVLNQYNYEKGAELNEKIYREVLA